MSASSPDTSRRPSTTDGRTVAGGSIRFVRTDGPSDFTVWLARPTPCPASDGRAAPCGHAGRVATSSSTRTGGWAPLRAGPTVETYRHYVVNHEVSPGWASAMRAVQHRGSGRQSWSSSQGGAAMGTCSFNVWPTPGAQRAGPGTGSVTPRSAQPGRPVRQRRHGRGHPHDRTGRSPGPPSAVELAGWTVDGDTVAPSPSWSWPTVDRSRRCPPIRNGWMWRLRSGTARATVSTTVPVGPDTVQVCVVAVGTGSGPRSASSAARWSSDRRGLTAPSDRHSSSVRPMLITTGFDLPGYDITSVQGEIFGLTVGPQHRRRLHRRVPIHRWRRDPRVRKLLAQSREAMAHGRGGPQAGQHGHHRDALRLGAIGQWADLRTEPASPSTR